MRDADKTVDGNDLDVSEIRCLTHCAHDKNAMLLVFL